MTGEMWAYFIIFVGIPSLILMGVLVLSLIRIREVFDSTGDLVNTAIHKFNKFLDN